MTRMSEPRRRSIADAARKSPRRLRLRLLARALHVLPALVLVGCILPPSLSVDNQDAGVDSPPAITSVVSNTQELQEPGPVEFVVGPVQGQTMDLTLIDSDVTDTLYIRVFVNYFATQPTPPRATCSASPTGSPIRTTTCDLSTLCDTSFSGNSNVWMEIAVFDRAVLDSGTPAYKATDGGLSTDRTYNLLCEQPSST
jgi:hypothetical protein